jgi:hypothetical protein
MALLSMQYPLSKNSLLIIDGFSSAILDLLSSHKIQSSLPSLPPLIRALNHVNLLVLPPPLLLLLLLPVQAPTPPPTAHPRDILAAAVRAQTGLLHRIPIIRPLPPRHAHRRRQPLIPRRARLLPLQRPGLRCVLWRRRGSVLRVQALDARAAHARGRGPLLPALLRRPGRAGVAGFLLVAQGEEVAVGGEGVPGLGGRGRVVAGVELWARGLVVEGLALRRHAFHVVVFVAEPFPTFVVLLSLFLPLVAHDCFVGEVGRPEN